MLTFHSDISLRCHSAIRLILIMCLQIQITVNYTAHVKMNFVSQCNNEIYNTQTNLRALAGA